MIGIGIDLSIVAVGVAVIVDSVGDELIKLISVG
jgi:hypothetical protein